MAEYQKHYELDYSQGGDTLDEFAQKYMAETTRIFRFLNDLRANKTNNIEYTEPVSGQWKVEDDKIYIRNTDNTEWVYLFDVENHGGLKSDTIGKMASGAATDIPVSGSNYDIFYDTTNERMYMWLNGAWKMQSSRKVSDLAGYSNLLQTSDIGTDSGNIVTYSADNEITTKAGYKMLTTNDIGTGADKIVTYSDEDKITTKSGYTVLSSNNVNKGAGGIVTYESQNIIKTANGYTVLTSNDKGNTSGKIVTYSADNEITTKDGYVVLTNNDIGTIAGKIPVININGKLPVDISGNAAKIANINAEVNNLQDGQVLTYRAASGTWRNEDKGVVGAGKALAVYDDDRLMIEYDGNAPEKINIGTWKGYDIEITPLSNSTFTVAGDATDIYDVGRNVKVIYDDELSPELTTILSADYDSVTEVTTVEVTDEVISNATVSVIYNPTDEKITESVTAAINAHNTDANAHSQVESLGTLTSDTEIDMSVPIQQLTVGANIELSFDAPSTNGATVTLIIANAGAYTLAWDGVDFPYHTAPTLTENGTDMVTIVSDGTKLYGVAAQDMG